ncbi:MAG: endopeptidase La [Clostridia bacterium]|nr:MAG: endopeptidase La [Clostridia bacterium]
MILNDEDAPLMEGELREDDRILEYAVIPSRDVIVYPRTVAPLFISRTIPLLALESAQDEGLPLLLLAQKNSAIDSPHLDDLYQTGVEILPERILRMPDDSLNVFAQGRYRVEVMDVVEEDPFMIVLARRLPEIPASFDKENEALRRAVLAMFEKVIYLSQSIPDEVFVAAMNADGPAWLSDLIASALSVPLEKRQHVLEIMSPTERLQEISILLAEELDVLELENKIHEQVQHKMEGSQREYFLREQIRTIQAELGDDDEFSHEISDLTRRIDDSAMPESVKVRARKELARLGAMPPMAPETNIVHTYLSWLLDLPWGAPEESDDVDIAHAEAVLEAHHYGLKKAKERILEHIAVRKLAKDAMRTPILCFVGPPGTGKTSMGKSISEALGRKFVRVSLGGVRDESEIRGHRRTYIGAMPGRIIQTMRNAGVVNPVFMLDEVDKMGYDFRGDPSSALLEVLDPEQNNAFSDHYLDVPYDLSNVLFITTANNPYKIPSPLLDRMEVIEFPGYADFEKHLIARKFLIPRLLKEHGLAAVGLMLTDTALDEIIRNYTYEAGVRNLERETASIFRKLARKVASGKRIPRRITPHAVRDMLGPPRYADYKLETEDQIGVATGLAWTEGGGDVMQVETLIMPGKGALILTGQLGDVMQESAQAALSYARSHAEDYGFADFDFDKYDIHLHFPEGAIPKDGPSAGVTIATALISALANRPVAHLLGMTGEITLRGRVFPVGGLKEKLLTAHRNHLKTVIVPKRNEMDLIEVPKHIRRALDIKFVTHLEQVLALALLPPVIEDDGLDHGVASEKLSSSLESLN